MDRQSLVLVFTTRFHCAARFCGASLFERGFCPEDETALEYMLHISNYEPVQWVKPREGQGFHRCRWLCRILFDFRSESGWPNRARRNART